MCIECVSYCYVLILLLFAFRLLKHLCCVLHFTYGSDSGAFTPGCVFIIDSPSKVDNYFGRERPSQLPIVETPIGVNIVDLLASRITSLPAVPISDDTSKVQGFHYPKATVNLRNFFLVDSKCMGRMCDGAMCYHNGIIVSKCPCFTAISRMSQIVGCFDLFVTITGDDNQTTTIDIREFTSRRFTSLFLSGSIPLGLTATSINHNRERMRLIRRDIARILSRINERNGWSLTGWSRRGHTRDAAAAQPSAAQGDAGSLLAGRLSYHAVSILPNNDDNGNPVGIDDLLFSLDVGGTGAGGAGAVGNN